MRIAKIVGAAIASALALAACSTVAVNNLQVGDCFDDSNEFGAEVSTLPKVDCAEPHDAEVYYTFDVTASVWDSDAIIEEVDETCFEQFEGYVGIDYFDSELYYFFYSPSQAGFEAGDAGAICAIWSGSDTKLTGSMKDSNR